MRLVNVSYKTTDVHGRKVNEILNLRNIKVLFFRSTFVTILYIVLENRSRFMIKLENNSFGKFNKLLNQMESREYFCFVFAYKIMKKLVLSSKWSLQNDGTS